jgi:hypothetical protein
MLKPDLEATASVREALEDVRESLFDVAEEASRLTFPRGPNDVVRFLQSANYNLGEAERELAGVGS